jgi:hypothetical protein
MRLGLRPWPCARVALTVFAIQLFTEAILSLGTSVTATDFIAWLTFAFPTAAILATSMVLFAVRDTILRWLRIERDDSSPAAFAASAIALLAFCQACLVLIGLASAAVWALGAAIAASREDSFAALAGVPTWWGEGALASYWIWGEVAVLLSCPVLVRLARPIARLPRVTRASRVFA